MEHPERFGEIARNYDNNSRKGFPILPSTTISRATLESLAGLCYLADTERNIKTKGELENRPDKREYFTNPNLYGPATKALSKHLQCEGEAMYMKIFHPERLN